MHTDALVYKSNGRRFIRGNTVAMNRNLFII